MSSPVAVGAAAAAAAIVSLLSSKVKEKGKKREKKESLKQTHKKKPSMNKSGFFLCLRFFFLFALKNTEKHLMMEK